MAADVDREQLAGQRCVSIQSRNVQNLNMGIKSHGNRNEEKPLKYCYNFIFPHGEHFMFTANQMKCH